MRSFLLALALFLSSCAAAQSADTELTPTADNGETFGQVLAEYQALNARLQQVAYRIQSANTYICPVTSYDIGITVHLISDYPEEIQPIARALLGATEKLSIRTVRPGSPADLAGLKPADVIIRLGENYLPSGPTVKKLYESYQQSAQTNFRLTVKRAEIRTDYTLKPEKLCGYPVNVFFADHINGHTDGQEIWITSELMHTVADDVNLALIVAHEMFHAIDDHVNQVPSKQLELEADRMALIMIEKAGYNIERAVDYWQYAPHPHGSGQPGSMTHPTMGERLNNFRKTLREIRASD